MRHLSVHVLAILNGLQSNLGKDPERRKHWNQQEIYKIKDICSDVRDKIHKRNKCIKLADKSPGGWDTVKEYMSDDLASDTDDEKRIRQAETCTIRKRNQQENSQRRKTSTFSYFSELNADLLLFLNIEQGVETNGIE
jgi:hypothetical protein